MKLPLHHIPVIAERDGEFTVLFDAPPGETVWFIYLHNRITGSYPTRAYADYSETESLWYLRASVPMMIPYELYDLSVIPTTGRGDTVLNAVRIVPEIRDEYYFFQITDTHIPDWRTFPPLPVYVDRNTVDEFHQLMREFEVLNPEFVLHTGNLIDYSPQEWQYEIAQELLTSSPVPIYVTAGENDLGVFESYPIPGRHTWRRFFGSIMDYCFRYGDDFFCTAQVYDNPGRKSFSEEQMDWMESAFRSSEIEGDELQILFYNCDLRRIDGEGAQITDEFVDEIGLDLILYGHEGSNEVDFLGTANIPDIMTASTADDNGAFRVIKVAGNQIVSYNAHRFNNFSVNFEPPNNGLNYNITALVENDLEEEFSNCLIKFFLPRNASEIEFEGGELLQIIRSDTLITCYISFGITAYSSREISVYSVLGMRSDCSKVPEVPHIACYPNPFNSITKISFQGNIEFDRINPLNVNIYNNTGSLVNSYVYSGSNQALFWDGTDQRGMAVVSGVYLIRVFNENFKGFTKVLLIK
ncbi:metallophosphoesterase [bacterium]|nr:metallophosphoesterase [bacterium]